MRLLWRLRLLWPTLFLPCGHHPSGLRLGELAVVAVFAALGTPFFEIFERESFHNKAAKYSSLKPGMVSSLILSRLAVRPVS